MVAKSYTTVQNQCTLYPRHRQHPVSGTSSSSTFTSWIFPLEMLKNEGISVHKFNNV